MDGRSTDLQAAGFLMSVGAGTTYIRLKSIEMFRCFAVVIVVFFHTQSIFSRSMTIVPFNGLFSGGSRGVDLFFVLSGFIIAYVHRLDIGQPNQLINYSFNRAARIFPALWIMTSFALLFYVAGYGGASKAGKLAAYNILASFALLPQLKDALVNVTWSLKYEVFFYIIFGVLIMNARFGLFILLFWQVAAVILSSFFSINQLGLAGFYFTSICLEFGIGLGCAWILNLDFQIQKRGFPNIALLWALGLAGAVMFSLGMASGSGTQVSDPIARSGLVASHAWSINMLCALGSGVLIVSLVLLERADRINVPSVVVFLGNASYSIYIVHFSVLTIIFSLFVRYRVQVNDLFCFGAAVMSILVGSMFHIIIDKPIQTMLRAKVRPSLQSFSANTSRVASSRP